MVMRMFANVCLPPYPYIFKPQEFLRPFTKMPELPVLGPYIIVKPHFTACYDGRTKNPIWVYENLTPDSILGPIKKRHKFSRSKDLPPKHQASNSDMRNSGYTRGHMAAAGNHKVSVEARKDTFRFVNMSPQLGNVNNGKWKELEEKIRDIALRSISTEVVSGPLYLPSEGEIGERTVSYRVIGINNVAVPSHFFKIVKTLEEQNESIELVISAYIMPHEPIDEKTPVESFVSSVEKVSRLSGLTFNFLALPNEELEEGEIIEDLSESS